MSRSASSPYCFLAFRFVKVHLARTLPRAHLVPALLLATEKTERLAAYFHRSIELLTIAVRDFVSWLVETVGPLEVTRTADTSLNSSSNSVSSAATNFSDNFSKSSVLFTAAQASRALWGLGEFLETAAG